MKAVHVLILDETGPSEVTPSKFWLSTRAEADSSSTGANIRTVAADETAALALTALTTLSEDERLFRDSVYAFADREIRPLVRAMDEQAKIADGLIGKLVDLGVMGIEIPESFGGGG